ncbi:BPI fold-containing family B member 3-like [Liasis olivaceus]
MLKALALLLLCGLLSICQGGAENLYSVAQVDKAVLENLISDVLAKDDLLQKQLQRLLTGGVGRNLLGGLNGGQDGGLLDGVLGGQNGDLLGGVLGGQDGGLLGGVLGGQDGGLLGGVLGGQNGDLLGGVLGGQDGGLLGGVLGGQDGGLLGGPLGGEGLLWLKFVDITSPKVSLTLFPNVGIGLNIYTRVVLKGNTLLGGPLSLLVELNITINARLVQDKTGTPKLLAENCKTNIGGIQILSGFLPLVLDNVTTVLLNKLVPGALCPVADLVLNILNTVLATVNNVCPFGTLGTLHYTLAGLPLFRGQHIILNLKLMITDLEGKTTGFPTAQLPSLPVPPAVGHSSQLLLPRDLLSSLLQLLVSRGGFNADITEQALHGSIPMTTSALQPLLPKLSQLVAEDLPLGLRIEVHDVPALSLQNGKATILLEAALQVFAPTNLILTSLFTVDTLPPGTKVMQMTLWLQNISLSGIFTVTRTKLAISLALQSVSLSVPEMGSFDENGLKNWITNILQTGYLPLINGALNIGIPLPNIFNLNFVDGVVNTLEEMLVINKTPKFL